MRANTLRGIHVGKGRVEYKDIFFGSVKIIQLKCPFCGARQFKDEKCCECNRDLNFVDAIYKGAEFRSEITKRETIPPSIKEKVYNRDDFICQYCGSHCYESYLNDKNAITIDHLIPVAMGGTNDEDNLIACCRDCNFKKGARIFQSFEEAREYLLKQNKNEY